MGLVRRLFRAQDAQDLVEYALLVALVGLVGLAAWSVFQTRLGTAYGNYDTRTQNLSLIADTAVSATLFSQARFSYGRTRLEFPEYPNNPLRFQATSQFLIGGQSFPSRTGSIGQLLIEPFSPVGLDDYTFPQGRVNNTFQYAEASSWSMSGHSLRLGADVRRFQLNSVLDRLYRPLVVFGNAFTCTT